MTRNAIPADVRRFILTSISSVPCLEALLLIRGEPSARWDSPAVAQRLYMDERAVGELLAAMCEAGLLAPGTEIATYCYAPASDELRRIIDRLAETYAESLVEVTNLIHSETQKKAQRFADAFRWRKDP